VVVMGFLSVWSSGLPDLMQPNGCITLR